MIDVKKRVIKIVARCAGVNESSVKVEMTPEDLGVDSLDILHVTLDLDEEFDILINDEERDAIKTVQDMIDLVTKLVA